MTDDLTRRDMLHALGAGLMIAVASPIYAQPAGSNRRNDDRPAAPLAARLHIGTDNTITVMTGKVECGQGARAQITQAAAEELRVAPARIRLIMGDTDLCPDDGPTVGSRTTPSTLPTVRRACATAREALVDFAARRWNVNPAAIAITGAATLVHADRSFTFGEIAQDAEWTKRLNETTVPNDGVTLTRIDDWAVLGRSLGRPDGRDIVVGTHHYPSDIQRPGMLYGKVLRPPAIGSTLREIDLDAAKSIGDDVVVTRDGDFVGVAASKSFLARRAVDALAKTANWQANPPVDSSELFGHLRSTAREPERLKSPVTDSARTLRAEYHFAYVQHVPLEPRAAVAEWDEAGKLTVWTATQIPMRVRGELQQAFNLSPEQVRVIVPDFGGAFGGKHTGESAVEAARIARAAKRPVSLRWTRDEEFQWAAFRPAALIQADARLEADGTIADWFFVNVNSGGSGLASPYRSARKQETFVESTAPPLRHASYRALAATANHFARESFIDELANQAGVDPLAFRLKLLDEPRMIDVLNAAARRFDWASRCVECGGSRAVGLACGTEKGSFVAACAEVEVDERTKAIRAPYVVMAYECGKILNPLGLKAQVNGAILQSLGPALWERIELRGGVVTNGNLRDYRVPRFADVPKIDLELLDRPDLPSVGAGETPIVALAPAIANAVFRATGQRVRSMPIRLET